MGLGLVERETCWLTERRVLVDRVLTLVDEVVAD
jgi:hypothetical protein